MCVCVLFHTSSVCRCFFFTHFVLSSLFPHSRLFFHITGVDVLHCGLCLGTAALALLAGLPDVISSNCRLLSSFRSSMILLTGMLHLVLLGCAFEYPSLTYKLYCDKEFAGIQPIKAVLASFQ